jgi:2-polyprenyl-3-methyl-5-hydroxy-6-metoxy-1,4-benzoquinol methylase
MHLYLQLTEYVILRVIRRFLFSYSLLLRIGKYVPYFRVNANQDGAIQTVDAYMRLITQNAPHLLSRANLRILEVGSGVTDTVGILLADRIGCTVHTFDPYVVHDHQGTLASVKRFSVSELAQRSTVRVSAPQVSGYDFILSNSVLEHVANIDSFFLQLKEVLHSDGVMIHRVDYRDHFFKYPYFFLMFSETTWNALLNPGDLYRWRLDDHIAAAQKSGLAVKSYDEVVFEDDYKRIQSKITDHFRAYAKANVATANLVMMQLHDTDSRHTVSRVDGLD